MVIVARARIIFRRSSYRTSEALKLGGPLKKLSLGTGHFRWKDSITKNNAS
jgi:hypothetical protein